MKSMQKKYDSLEELVTDYQEKTEIVNQLKELDESELSVSQKETIKEQEELSNYLQEACMALDFVKFSTTVSLSENENDNKDKIECRSLLDSKEQYVQLYATLTGGGDESIIEAIEKNRQSIENFENTKAENDVLNVTTVSELENNTSVAFQLEDMKDAVENFFDEKREISIADFENAMLETFDVMDKNNIEKNGEVAFATANLSYEKNLAEETTVLAYENTYNLDNYEKDHAEIMKEIEGNKEEVEVPEIAIPEKVEIEIPEFAEKEEVETPNTTTEIAQIELPDDTVVVAVDNIVVMQSNEEVDNYIGKNIDEVIDEKFDLAREDIARENVVIETPNATTEVVLVPIENSAELESRNIEYVVAVESAVVLADDKSLIGQELETVLEEQKQVREQIERESKAEYIITDDTVIVGEVTEDNIAKVEDVKGDVEDIKEQKEEEKEDIKEQIEDEKEDIEEQKQDEIEDIQEQIEFEEEVQEQDDYEI